jgi:hypothetical protein
MMKNEDVTPLPAQSNRGNCPSFEPLLNAFIETLLNNNPELQLAQEVARKYA